ncbi:hypothetical protein THAOC_34768 [Thalassiosira oceanica]|uniref:Uncharacterized protein n=1 Tax=Thalassiosira oceanica TaxID=159749 RepID=K0RBS7_THAOC|nr:hypothetical protein THAOC_34768 [Thalassiosira oceanica]|eukprot:EJK46556.1 hypothetical protein THAOC_34768 [Thalassiosira oceanica]
MKFVQGALVASLSAASLSTSIDATQEVGRGRRRMDADYDLEDLVGLDNEAGYAEVARMFVGINPLIGIGSGFPTSVTTSSRAQSSPSVIRRRTTAGITCAHAIANRLRTVSGKRLTIPPSLSSSSAHRLSKIWFVIISLLSTRCVGWGGVQFRYSNMLWKDPVTGDWDGMMQGHQPRGVIGLNFLGSDKRIYPGGPAIFALAATEDATDGDISGAFRQGHDAVSCRAGLSDYYINGQSAEVDSRNGQGADINYRDGQGATCAYRCRNSDTYMEWLDYCAADEEDTSLGFSGYDM